MYSHSWNCPQHGLTHVMSVLPSFRLVVWLYSRRNINPFFSAQWRFEIHGLTSIINVLPSQHQSAERLSLIWFDWFCDCTPIALRWLVLSMHSHFSTNLLNLSLTWFDSCHECTPIAAKMSWTCSWHGLTVFWMYSHRYTNQLNLSMTCTQRRDGQWRVWTSVDSDVRKRQVS